MMELIGFVDADFLDKNGKHLFAFGSKGSARDYGKFSFPEGMAVFENGMLLHL
jgi:hypothetical protein